MQRWRAWVFCSGIRRPSRANEHRAASPSAASGAGRDGIGSRHCAGCSTSSVSCSAGRSWPRSMRCAIQSARSHGAIPSIVGSADRSRPPAGHAGEGGPRWLAHLLPVQHHAPLRLQGDEARRSGRVWSAAAARRGHRRGTGRRAQAWRMTVRSRRASARTPGASPRPSCLARTRRRRRASPHAR